MPYLAYVYRVRRDSLLIIKWLTAGLIARLIAKLIARLIAKLIARLIAKLIARLTAFEPDYVQIHVSYIGGGESAYKEYESATRDSVP